MEFLKERVFTPLNADEVKAGSKGYFADNLDDLKHDVKTENNPSVLKEVRSEDYDLRFKREDSLVYILFYLVEEPAEEKYRPYKNTDELIEDWKERTLAYGSAYFSKNPMFCPSIWVKGDRDSIRKFLITDFNCSYIKSKDHAWTLEDLFKGFVFLDGTPCGKKI